MPHQGLPSIVPNPGSAPGGFDPVVRIGVGPALEVGAVGGKAASLDRLTRLKQPVPQAICITADAFREQLALMDDPGRIARLVAALPAAAARAELIASFDSTPTVPALRSSIESGVAGLARDLAAAAGVTDPRGQASGDAAPRLSIDTLSFAVRSSALDEDGVGASFAGLHVTELGLFAREIEPAVRRCWLSLWSEPAVAYRARSGLGFGGLAMSVVVQALVPAAASAVVFTRHPVTGRSDQVLVNAVRGLGEPLVSGEAEPDTMLVDRSSRTILEWSRGRPGPRQFVERGRVIELHDPSLETVIDHAALTSLVDLALAVEASADVAVDIEAAFAGGTWFLLQSRPITS